MIITDCKCSCHRVNIMYTFCPACGCSEGIESEANV